MSLKYLQKSGIEIVCYGETSSLANGIGLLVVLESNEMNILDQIGLIIKESFSLLSNFILKFIVTLESRPTQHLLHCNSSN